MCTLAVFFAAILFGDRAAAALTAGNGAVYSATPIVNNIKTAAGTAPDGSKFFCLASAGFDGSVTLYRYDASGSLAILGTDSQTGGLTMLYKNQAYLGCAQDNAGNTVAFAVLFDPNRNTANNLPYASLWYFNSNGTSGPLLQNNVTQFQATDPRTGNSVMFTYQQPSLQFPVIETRNGKAVMLIVASPPPASGANVQAIPQSVFVQVGADKQITPLFFNAKDAQSSWFPYLSTLFAVTDNFLYVTAAGSASDKTLSVYRIVNGQPVMVKAAFQPVGYGIASWDNGIQTYGTDGQNILASFLPDNSTPIGQGFNSGESPIFAGAVADNAALSGQDRQYISGPESLFLVTSQSPSLIMFSGGNKARLLKTAQVAPAGTPFAASSAGGQTLYVQSESLGLKTYRIYIPELDQAEYAVVAGGSFNLLGKNLVIEGSLPSLSFRNGNGAVQLPYGANSNGDITVSVPPGAPGGQISGQVSVVGIPLNFTVTVLPPGPPAPAVNAVVNAASFKAEPVAPGSLISVFFTGSAGQTGQISSFGQIEVGGVSATIDGTSLPVIANSGAGQLNVYVPPGIVKGKTVGSLELSVTAGGQTIKSQPFAVKFSASPQDALFTIGKDSDGVMIPAATHADGRIINLASPTASNETIVLYGTGCITNPAPPDNALAASVLNEVTMPILQIGNVSITPQFAGLIPNFAGLCQYNIALPAGMSGDTAIQFAGVPGLPLTLRVH